MSKRCKINAKTMLPIVACGYLLILTFLMQANAAAPIPTNFTQQRIDTVPEKPKLDTTPVKSDSLAKRQRPDSISKIDTIRISKDSIDAPIKYASADY
jgi:LPS-assembly protein